MIKVFADTSYWIALLNPHDSLHRKAMALGKSLSSAKVVTSEMVLAEFLNAFSGFGSHFRGAAAEVVIRLRTNPSGIVRAQTSIQFESALSGYRHAADKNWSLTDCASFQIMEAEAISSALTSDRHFVQAGYEALLAD